VFLRQNGSWASDNETPSRRGAVPSQPPRTRAQLDADYRREWAEQFVDDSPPPTPAYTYVPEDPRDKADREQFIADWRQTDRHHVAANTGRSFTGGEGIIRPTNITEFRGIPRMADGSPIIGTDGLPVFERNSPGYPETVYRRDRTPEDQEFLDRARAAYDQ
jgi:hypothetical protein